MGGCEVTRSDVNLSFAILFYTPRELGKFFCTMYVPKPMSFVLRATQLEY
jgi:hypothetical protein